MQTDRQINRQVDSTSLEIEKTQTDANKQTDRPTDRQTERRKNRNDFWK
jgi:hypothetical protein